MFLSVEVEEKIALSCKEVGLTAEETRQSLKRKLSEKFVDKVIPDHGLVTHVLDVLKVDSLPILGPNDGRPCFLVRSQMLIFRPQARELISGVISTSDQTGLRVSLKFFGDVRIPAHLLASPSAYDEDTKLWYWKVQGADESGLMRETNLYYEIGSHIRFRAEDCIFSRENAESSDKKLESEAVPMLIVGSMKEPGTGVVSWWS